MKASISRKNGKNHGEVFTDQNAVRFILDEVGYLGDANLCGTSILEPASGKGAFAVEIIKRLFLSSQRHGFPFGDALRNNVRFVERDEVSFCALVHAVDGTVRDLTENLSSVGREICLCADFLTVEPDRKFDCIVGNPPYIRHERIPEEDRGLYRKTYATFRHRADLYIAFYERGLQLLKETGILCFVSSNRWLNNQYGEGLRGMIARHYRLIKLLNIEKSSPFDEKVTAYPCIATVANTAGRGETVLYCEDSAASVNFGKLRFEEKPSPEGSSWHNLFLNYDIRHGALCGILEQGFSIGIGVATGADGIFIKAKSELDEIESSRLLPVLMSKDLRNNTFKWSGHYVINPYEGGDLCDIDRYPRLKRYLLEHKNMLQKRHTAKKSPDKWFRTIDRIRPELLRKSKLLLPDLTGNRILFIDEGNFYPHHNLYYVTSDRYGLDGLKILAGILMSDFVREQMARIGIRMNGGLPRFQSQILKKIRVPNIALMDARERETLVDGYNGGDIQKLNSVIINYCSRRSIGQCATV